MANLVPLIFFLMSFLGACGQLSMDGIKTSFVLQMQRQKMEKGLHDYTINGSFSLPLNKENEYRYQSAFWAISQFLIADSNVLLGFRKSLDSYDSLEKETKRSFLEALYAVDPSGFEKEVWQKIQKENDPKLMAMGLLFLNRRSGNQYPVEKLMATARQKFPPDGKWPIMDALDGWMKDKPPPLPPLQDLLQFNKERGIKVIYSFQRHDRDQQGLAIIQYADGKLARDEQGKIISIRQLARSGSSLPYFITNGNTPQGIYSIQGIDTSYNNFIGPTPNLQLIMPNEYYWNAFFHSTSDTTNAITAYRSLMPETWMYHVPMMESFTAGKLGRTEIIAHGTTIDPQYFSGKPYHPISPTLGCLCSRESWNTTTGHLIESEQFRLVDTFLKTTGNNGYLFVIDLDSQHRPVGLDELEEMLKDF
jgi:hypothetical protein